jgi:hypothetical protein
MKKIATLVLMVLLIRPVFAVDEGASMLIAMGQVRLEDINDKIGRQYPGKKGIYWNIAGTAYHHFSKAPHTDVIIGIAGYKDVGVIYNAGRQMVEDAGSGFAYFHKVKDDWKLIQVELVDGKKYEGYEGADLASLGADQLVVYSASGVTQIADIYRFEPNGRFKKMGSVTGYGEGPQVAWEAGKPLMVDFQRTMIKNGDEFQIYYGRPYRWNGREFLKDKDDFLDLVQTYDPVHPIHAGSAKDLEFFENYAADHPEDFCAVANCFGLSRRLGLKDKMAEYTKRLMGMAGKPVVGPYCDSWIAGKNQAAQQLYLEWVSSLEK